MPYISASIIFQLLTTVVPSLEKMQKEGETGRRKIQEWTRYTTVPLCAVQAMFWLVWLHNMDMVQPAFQRSSAFWMMGVFSLTAGCVFLMWLGEQIDGIRFGQRHQPCSSWPAFVARMPTVFLQLITQTSFSTVTTAEKPISMGKIVFLIFAFRVRGGWLDPDYPGPAGASRSSRPSTPVAGASTAARSSSCRCASIMAASCRSSSRSR